MYPLTSQSLKNIHKATSEKPKNSPYNITQFKTNKNINEILNKNKILNSDEKLPKDKLPSYSKNNIKKNLVKSKFLSIQYIYNYQKSERMNSSFISSKSSKKSIKKDKSTNKQENKKPSFRGQSKTKNPRQIRRSSIFRRMIGAPMKYDKLIEIRKKINKRLKDKYISLEFKINYNADYIRDITGHPLIWDYYQINNLILNKKCHLKSKLDDYNLFYNNGQEYLIKYYSDFEYSIIIRYLLFIVYGDDIMTFSDRLQCYYDLADIQNVFRSYISKEINFRIDFKYNYAKPFYKNGNYIKTLSNKNLTILANSNIDLNKNIKNGNKKENEIINSEYVNKFLSNINSKFNYYNGGLGLCYADNNFFNYSLISCKFRRPQFLFIKDIPKKKIPNILPNQFLHKDNYKIFYKFYVQKQRFQKLKNPKNMLLYSDILSNNSSKSKTIYDKNMMNNNDSDFSKIGSIDLFKNDEDTVSSNLSMSAMEVMLVKERKDSVGTSMNHNINRRTKNDNDIVDIEKWINEFNDLEKEKKNRIQKKRKSVTKCFQSLRKKSIIRTKNSIKSNLISNARFEKNEKKSIRTIGTTFKSSGTKISGTNDDNFILENNNNIQNLKMNSNNINAENIYVEQNKNNKNIFYNNILLKNKNNNNYFLSSNVYLNTPTLQKNNTISNDKIKRSYTGGANSISINNVATTKYNNKYFKMSESNSVFKINKSKNYFNLNIQRNIPKSRNKNKQPKIYLLTSNNKNDLNEDKTKKNSFKGIDYFLLGMNMEKDKIEYQMNLIKDVTNDYNKNLYKYYQNRNLKMKNHRSIEHKNFSKKYKLYDEFKTDNNIKGIKLKDIVNSKNKIFSL